MLIKAQVDYYNENGFLVIENVLSQEVLDEANRIIDEFVERSRSVSVSNDVYDLEPNHTPERPLVRRLKSPAKQHPFFDELVRSDMLLAAAVDIIGENIRLQNSKLNMKSVGSVSPVEWHQDFAFYPCTNADVLAIGVYLNDSTLENGCMLMIPGSHKGPILDHHQDGVFVGAITPSRGEVDLSKAVPVEAKAGSISIHHGHMLHGSAQNTSTKPRRLLLYEMMAADAWPIMGVKDFDDFKAATIRGTWTLEPRIEKVHARIPLPLPKKAGSIFEIQEQAKESVFARR